MISKHNVRKFPLKTADSHFLAAYLCQDSLIANLLRLIQKMKPKTEKVKSKKKKKKKDKDPDESGGGEWGEAADKLSEDIKLKQKMFPGLALPDNPAARVRPIYICMYLFVDYVCIFLFLLMK